MGQGDAEMELAQSEGDRREEASAPMKRTWDRLSWAELVRRELLGGVPRKQLPGHREWKAREQPLRGCGPSLGL